MSDQFLGQIMMAAFNFAPKGWALCDGALLSIQQNTALYSLLSNHYGGDARTTFGLPDLRGRTPVGLSTKAPFDYPIQGQTFGSETVALTISTIPPHMHTIIAATTDATGGIATRIPAAAIVVTSGQQQATFAAPSNPLALLGNPVSSVGGGAAHPNMQPYTVVNFAIALTGVYPMRP